MTKFWLVLALACVWCTSAGAQTAPVWSEPAGRFTLAFEDLGWTALPAPEPSDEGYLLGIEHRRFQEDGSMRTCFMTERSQSIPPHVSQSDINAMTMARGVTILERTVGGAPTRSAVTDINGVSVIGATFTSPIHQQMRVFYLKDGSSLRQILINLRRHRSGHARSHRQYRRAAADTPDRA